ADDGIRDGHVTGVQSCALPISPVLEALWGEVTAVLTSATIPSTLPIRLGLPAGDHDQLDVGSPFDFGANALLYCSAHLPDPRARSEERRVGTDQRTSVSRTL